MSSVTRAPLMFLLSATIGICIWSGTQTATASPADKTNLAAAARQVIEKHCFECHGASPKKIIADLNVLEPSSLLDIERKLVVPGKPNDSELFLRVIADKIDERMPPAPRPVLDESERQALRDWISAGAPAFVPKDPPAIKTATVDLSAQVKEVFRVHCFDCHGGTSTKAGVRILDWDSLVTKKKKVIPSKPQDSAVYRVISALDQTVMPPQGRPRLGESDLILIRDWIAAGAAPFPEDLVASPIAPVVKDAGADYVLGQILQHVRTLNVEDRQFVRYFSTNHRMTAGVSRPEIDRQRDALAKAINHLSRERTIVVPQVIDAPLATIFAVDIRQLGWHKQPLSRIVEGRPSSASSLTIYDLALLEYPYAVINEESTTYATLLEEYMGPGRFIRPIPYLRIDWFVSTVTQPPLYEDFLQLPLDVADLEKQLNIDSAGNLRASLAKRAGMTSSGVSRNNRVVEWHAAPNGSYWKSIDTATSKGRENMFRDPVHVEGSGGEMIFSLPNGLQAYFLAAANGRRVDAAPTNIVTDKFAEDKIVRNGLACMRCHIQGMKDFVDNVRPAVEQLPGSPGFNKSSVLALYPPQADMDKLLEEDRVRFLAAMEKVMGRPDAEEPLAPVSHHYIDEPLSLGIVAGELGLSRTGDLAVLFRSPKLVRLGLASLGSPGGVARRDMWEDGFHEVIRDLGVGLPVVPLDGLTRTNFGSTESGIDVQLGTNRSGNTFAPGDQLVINVSNNSRTDIHIELLGTSEKGEKVVLAPATTIVKAGHQYRFPEVGSIIVRGGVGKEQITLFACDEAFPAGEILRGRGTADRIVHRFYRMKMDRGHPQLEFDPSRMVKQTLEIETK